MNEADTCRTRILPKLKNAQWEDDAILEQYVLRNIRAISIVPGNGYAYTYNDGGVFIPADRYFNFLPSLHTMLLHEAFHNSGVPNAKDEDAAVAFASQCDWDRYFPP